MSKVTGRESWKMGTPMRVFITLCGLGILVSIAAWWTGRGSDGDSRIERRVPRERLASTKPRIVHPLAAPPLLSHNERDGAMVAGTGENHQITQEQIMSWVREGRVLSAEDCSSLIAFLGTGQPERMESGDWEERVNEILNLLRSQPGEVPGLAEAMMRMAEEDPNPVLRMYALQHMAMRIPDEPSEEVRKAMILHLRQLTWSSDDPLAGSAVLFLSDLERAGKLAEDFTANGEIGETAARIASDPTAAPDVRIAALHACVDQGTAAALPAARRIAADDSLMVPLRKAAIHTVGRFGGPEDIALLKEVGDKAPTLAAATGPAIERLGGKYPADEPGS